MCILGAHRRRASQAIALNITEGNGKATSGDRCRSFEIARGFALECAAIEDVLAGVRCVVRRRQQQAKGTARSSCGHADDARTAWRRGQRGAWRMGWSVRYRRRYRRR
ncbi:MAG: four helix bundle protein [Thiohalocapsa sp. PB-PSB1]|nr:MAG: four helix bundle protein [Thiohalocapsa sp. PB-PSB1]